MEQSQERLRLSPSRVGDFTNCPQLYKYRAILNLPEKISLDAERGKLVHSVLEDLFELPREDRTPASALELLPLKWQEHLEKCVQIIFILV
jgi:putative RecB family exonuclease